MLVYRNEEQAHDARSLWRALVRGAEALGTNSPHDDVVSLVIDLGEFEAGVADALFPHEDGMDPVAQALRESSVAAGNVVIASWRHRETLAATAAVLRRALDRVPVAHLPRTIAVRPSEGYAFYGLHPESFAVSAASFLTRARPSAAVIVGIRGIGTSLSAVVAAQARRLDIDVRSYTVRPHGHPFDRHVSLRADLAASVRAQPPGTTFLIVDEGPGLSGSSFASTVRALTASGVAAPRIILFPSWNPDGSRFKCESARQVWQQHVRCPAEPSIGETYLRDGIDHGAASVDVSAGIWRRHWCGAHQPWPAVHPQHERRKLWTPSHKHVTRFAGLGRYGAARLRRAESLASSGLGAHPIRLRNGYLRLQYVGGAPCTAADGGNPRLVARIAEHVGFLSRHLPSTARVPVDDVREMMETNVRLALGSEWLPAIQAVDRSRSAVEEGGSVEIDGRMLPHEWIRDGDEFHKVDALDHHADHFFPGVQDAAWDLAAASMEFELTEAAATELIDEYTRKSGDRDIAARLPWHRLAYLAFRIGYVSLAADALAETEDGARFRRMRSRYEALLRRELALTPSAP